MSVKTSQAFVAVETDVARQLTCHPNKIGPIDSLCFDVFMMAKWLFKPSGL